MHQLINEKKVLNWIELIYFILHIVYTLRFYYDKKVTKKLIQKPNRCVIKMSFLTSISAHALLPLLEEVRPKYLPHGYGHEALVSGFWMDAWRKRKTQILSFTFVFELNSIDCWTACIFQKLFLFHFRLNNPEYVAAAQQYHILYVSITQWNSAISTSEVFAIVVFAITNVYRLFVCHILVTVRLSWTIPMNYVHEVVTCDPTMAGTSS